MTVYRTDHFRIARQVFDGDTPSAPATGFAFLKSVVRPLGNGRSVAMHFYQPTDPGPGPTGPLTWDNTAITFDSTEITFDQTFF